MGDEIINKWGKPIDELDILKLQMAATEIVGFGCAYSIESIDGLPICGFVNTESPTRLVTSKWGKR